LACTTMINSGTRLPAGGAAALRTMRPLLAILYLVLRALSMNEAHASCSRAQ
jgi:hypothetical protein